MFGHGKIHIAKSDTKLRTQENFPRNPYTFACALQHGPYAHSNGIVMMSDDYQDRPRRPMRETVCDFDKDILKLLVRRHNLLEKMKNSKGRLSPQDERFIRESWENQVGKVSSDPNLSSRFFTLLQDVTFFEAPTGRESSKHTSFGLAPSQSPVSIEMFAPCDQEQTALWCYTAACSGHETHLTHIVMNDPVFDCVRMLNQFESSLYREDGKDTISSAQSAPATAPDKVIHVGDSFLNFYLAVAHYIGRPSHAKFTGGSELKLADFSFLRHFLPQVNARATSLIPQSTGVPMRMESAGLMPETIALTEDLPCDFVLALCIAAPFYQNPVAIDFAQYPSKLADSVLSRALPVLKKAGCEYEKSDSVLHFKGKPEKLPKTPLLDIDTGIAAILAMHCAVNGGSAELKGHWPETAASAAVENLFSQLGLSFAKGDDKITLSAGEGYTLTKDTLAVPAGLAPELIALPCALACVQALKYGSATIPANCPSDNTFRETLSSFAAACGLLLNDDVLEQRHDDEEEHGTPEWCAPTPQWACALALAALARPHVRRGFKLNNPGILTALYPEFWTWYNQLPAPIVGQKEKENTVAADAAPVRERRRIRTKVDAELTPVPEDY